MSLYKYTKTQIKQNHPEVYESRRQSFYLNLKNSITAPSSWRLILVFYSFVALIFLILWGFNISLSIIGIFDIDKKLADILVDARLTNIAPIIGFAFVVIGFLINNLREKDRVSYQLLFKYSYLNPIIQYALITIFMIILLSYLRNTIENDIFIKAVVFSMYLIGFILVTIGYLFSKFIHYSDKNYINELFLREIRLNAKRLLMRELIKAISRNHYKEYLNNLNLNEIDPFDTSKDNNPKIFRGSGKFNYLIDVKLDKLSKYLVASKTMHNDLEIEFVNHGIYDIILPDKVIFRLNIDILDNNSFSKNILKCFKFKKGDSSLEKDYEDVIENFHERILKAIDNNDTKTVESLTRGYSQIYELYLNQFGKFID